MMTKFYSDRPDLYFVLPIAADFPITSLKVMNSGVDFDSNGEFVTTDKTLISCLRHYIELRSKYCRIEEKNFNSL